jgi:hypothetical protein
VDELRKHEERHARLSSLMMLKPGDDLLAIVTRASPVLRAVNLRWEQVFLSYYGYGASPAPSCNTIGATLGISAEVVRIMRDKACAKVFEVLTTMRREKLEPDSFDGWTTREFFTTERGLQAKVLPETVTRIRNALSQNDLSRLTSILALSEREIRSLPHLGTVAARRVRAMLATADLTLAP